MRNTALLGALLLLLFSARADINSPLPPPPQPQAGKVEILVGEKAEIILRAKSRINLPLTFIIRNPPKHGTLSEIKLINDRSAKVIYQPSPNSKPGMDFFTYAVQGPGTGVSSPERVTIAITEPSPEFEAPAFLNFENVSIGETAKKSITLTNKGGGLIKGTLELPPPWKISDEGRYRLATDQSKEFTITFTPAEGREYREIIAYSNDPQRHLSLTGTGLLPLKIDRTALPLKAEEDGQRTGVLEITNISDKPREITFKAAEILASISNVTLQPQETKTITVKTTGRPLNAINTPLKIQSGIFEVTLPITAFALPAKLTFDSADTLEFGYVAPGHIYRKTIAVINSGGTSAILKVLLPEGVSLTPDPIKTSIGSGQTVKFDVAMEAAGKVGDAPVLAFVHEGKEIKEFLLNYALEGNPHLASRTPPLLSVIKPTEAETSAPTHPTNSGISMALIHPPNWKPRIGQIGVMEQGKTQMHLVWKKVSNVEPDSYFLEQLVRSKKSAETGDWQWIRVKNARITTDNNYVHAVLTGLRSGETTSYRIVVRDNEDVFTPISEMFRVSTKGSPRGFRPSLPLVLSLIVVVLLYFIWKERRRQMAELTDETNRISKQ
ncbi:MAG: hypothetical protein ABI615_11330 [Chthoniobacterales bacterium]